MLTTAQRRALEILVKHGELGGAQFGYKMWPKHSEYGRPLRPQGAGFAGGGYLRKLEKLGLVDHWHNEHRYCAMYRISKKGRESLCRTGGAT